MGNMWRLQYLIPKPNIGHTVSYIMSTLVPYYFFSKCGTYRRAVRRKANFLTRTKKSQFRPKNTIVWAHFWLFSGDIGFSSSGSLSWLFFRTARRYISIMLENYGRYSAEPPEPRMAHTWPIHCPQFSFTWVLLT